MAHNYLVTAQQATVVSNSHCGYFTSENELSTILIKGNNIEIYALSTDDGFEKINELPFYGRIIQSVLFRPPKCTTDHLFLLTQSFSFCIIATDPLTNQIITKASGQLKEENASIKTSSTSLISVDQSQQNIIVHIYKGEILLIQLDEYGKLKAHATAEKIIIHELEILSLTFLCTKHQKNILLNDNSNSNIFDDDDISMNINAVDDTQNDTNINDLSAPLITSTKSKATRVLKSKLTKMNDKLNTTTTKMNEKLHKLKARKRKKSSSSSLSSIAAEAKSMDNDYDENEEKKASDPSVLSERLLLCVLYQDYRKGRHIKTYYLNKSMFELDDGPWDTLMVEEGCNKLIAVQAPLYGVLFVGQYSIAYRNRDNCQRVQVPDGDLCCYDVIVHNRKNGMHRSEEMEDEDYDPNTIVDGTRWLIGDGLNRSLNILVLRHNEKFEVKSLNFERLGEIVSPSTISYICSGLTFVGSTVGDSQFIEIHSDKNWRKKREQEEAEHELGEEEDEDDDITMHTDTDNKMSDVDDGYVEILEEFTNLGPIVDLVTVDLERQGQCQLVTCSGVGRDGSLRVIKNGIGIEEVAEISMEGIQGLWGLKEDSSSIYDKYLITSFISETRVLAMTEEGLEEMEMNGLNQLIRSIHCANMCDDNFCQIGESEINLIDLMDNFSLKYKWKLEENNIKINSCTSNTSQLLCALSNGNLILLQLQMDKKCLIHCENKCKLEHEISCVALSPTFESINHNKSLFCAVGMWKDYSIRILSLPQFNILIKFPLQTDIVPRSVLITNFNSPKDQYLFVGMGDGSLIEAKLDIKLNRNTNISGIELVKQKKMPLGTQPVRLLPFKCNDISYIFGGCDRPTVIYLLNNRMFYANVNLPEINFMTEFNARDFPDCLAMSCLGNLMIGQMDHVQKLHITKIALYEQPRRICYNVDTNSYLLASQCTTDNNNNYFHPAYNQTIYKLTLRDGQNIEDVLYTKILEPYWNITKIITHKFKCDPHVTYFIITSCLAKPHEKSPSAGKVQVCMVMTDENDNKNEGQGTKLKIVHSKSFRGDPTCIRGIGEDYLLCGVRSKIQLFRWMLKSLNPHNNNDTNQDIANIDDEDEYPFELHHLHTIHNNTFVLDIKVHGDFFIVIDLMKSISMFLLQYTGHKQQSNSNKEQMIDGTLINVNDSKAAQKQLHGKYGAIISEVARDYDPSWMKCGEMYNDQYLVGIDSFCNFFILKRNIDSLNEDERGRLDVVCRIHWGDDINVLTHGSLVMDIPIDIAIETHKIDKKSIADKTDKIEMDESDDNDEDEEKVKDNHSYNIAMLRPTDLRKCVFGTIDGSIGVLICIPYNRYDVLQKLEKSLRKFVQGLGGLDHYEWRKFKNQTDGKQAVGFLDGDLIETFLNLTNDQQEKIANDMKIDTHSLTKIVEEMNRLH